MQFDFTNVDCVHIDADYILKNISEQTIWTYYFGQFSLGKVYKSKFRRDNMPSTGFYVNRSGHIIYHDLKTKEKLNCFCFVMKMYGLTFKGALKKIAYDFGLTSSNCIVPEKIFKIAAQTSLEKPPTLIQFLPEKWNKDNSLFWRYGEITIDELKKEDDLFPVKSLFVNNKEIANPHKFDRYAYIVNYEEDGIQKQGVKIYSPYDTNMKFLSSIPLNIVGWLDRLKFQDDKCFIVKSRKDCQIMKKFFTDMVWVQNETSSALPQKTIDYLKSKYKRVIVLFGADNHGRDNCIEITKANGLEYFNTLKADYEQHGIEDPYDTVKQFGLKYFEQQLIDKHLL